MSQKLYQGFGNEVGFQFYDFGYGFGFSFSAALALDSGSGLPIISVWSAVHGFELYLKIYIHFDF